MSYQFAIILGLGIWAVLVVLIFPVFYAAKLADARIEAMAHGEGIASEGEIR